MAAKLKHKPTDTVQVNLRIKERLRRRLDKAAKDRQVSLNAEMMQRLEQSLEADRFAEFGERMARLEGTVDALVVLSGMKVVRT